MSGNVLNTHTLQVTQRSIERVEGDKVWHADGETRGTGLWHRAFEAVGIERVLQMQPSGRWAVCRPGSAPVEITSGELFRVEVDGKLEVTRMEFAHADRGDGEYYSVDGYHLANGMRAAIGGQD